MPENKGIIALMGSGELTATMVEVHKALLQPFGKDGRAVFIDTPAGFQLNVDHIARRAAEYFSSRVQHKLTVTSYKSHDEISDWDLQQALRKVSNADYLLIGPGSPTYAIRQWQQSPLPGLIARRIEAGGCLTAASAAALTVGRYTLPVYEIYKVGQPLHWVEGLDLLGRFGMNLVVIPHWNNAEGGNHDTRFCFMGAPRLEKLEAILPQPVDILGLDEHTALIIDLARQETAIKGMGRVTLRRNGEERTFTRDDPIPMALLLGERMENAPEPSPSEAAPQSETTPPQHQEDPLWDRLHHLAEQSRRAIDRHRAEDATQALLELERHIWRSQQQLMESEAIGAARELLREVLAVFGSRLSSLPASREQCLAPLVDALLTLRATLRDQKQFESADAIRDCLQQVGVLVEDTAHGARWYVEG